MYLILYIAAAISLLTVATGYYMYKVKDGKSVVRLPNT